MSTWRRLAAVAAGLALAVGLAGCSGDEAADLPRPSPLAGIHDDRLIAPGADAPARVATMSALGARVLRVDLRWDLVAPRRPRRPRDPDDSAYRWERYDRIVAAARERDVEILFAVWGTPTWARATGVPPSDRFPGRATRPADPEDLGRFGAAAARRYGPRGVTRWEAWNEPNLPLFLRPQFRRESGRLVAVSPRVYSRMLAAFYREVKSVDADATVAGGVTAPIGDGCPYSCPDGVDDRVAPLDFWRALVAPANLPPMDRVSHHPYPVTRPRDETSPRVSYVDLYNLDRLTRLLAASPLAETPLWLTEFGFATRPVREYPLAFDEERQAEYLADAWARVRDRRDVELLVWFNLRDHPQWASGLLRADGRPKPAAWAFAAPVVARPPRLEGRGRVRIEGQFRRADAAGPVVVERRDRGLSPREWVTAAEVRSGRDGTFAATIRLDRAAEVRARWGGPVRDADAGQELTSPPVAVQVAR